MFEGQDKLVLRTTQPVFSSSTNGSAITIQTVALSKKVNTTMAGLIFLLTMGTYSFLVVYTTRLSNEITLPSKFLAENMTTVLSFAWPKKYSRSVEETDAFSHIPWVLFYKEIVPTIEPGRSSVDEENPLLVALGSDEIPETRDGYRPVAKHPMLTFKAFSPVMKSLVQIAIWTFFSVWLVFVMIVNTVVYNGFASKNITNDSIIRLVLVGIYVVANIGYQFRATILLYRSFTLVLFQAYWAIICRRFIFLDSRDYRLHIFDPAKSSLKRDWRSLNFELFGTMERSNTYQKLFPFVVNGKRMESCLKAQDKTESKFDKFVKPLREAEIKVYEKATDSVLEKTLANIAVLLGICLATALAPWTSFQTTNATAAQLGSYALLLSISTGISALVSCVTQLTNATESARILLLLQERTIAAGRDDHESEAASTDIWFWEKPERSFSKGIDG